MLHQLSMFLYWCPFSSILSICRQSPSIEFTCVQYRIKTLAQSGKHPLWKVPTLQREADAMWSTKPAFGGWIGTWLEWLSCPLSRVPGSQVTVSSLIVHTTGHWSLVAVLSNSQSRHFALITTFESFGTDVSSESSISSLPARESLMAPRKRPSCKVFRVKEKS